MVLYIISHIRQEGAECNQPLIAGTTALLVKNINSFTDLHFLNVREESLINFVIL